MTASMTLLAAGIPPGLETLIGSLALGTAVGLAARELVVILMEPRKDLSVGNLLEHQRRTALRQRSRSYRFLEPLVDRLEPMGSRLWANRLPDLQRELEMVEPQAPWKASEYLVLKSLEALPVVLLAALFALVLFGSLPAVTLVVLALLVLPTLNRRRVSDRARRYRIAVRNQLPFVVDLMALMLESGAIFRECLETAAEENRGEPVGEEFNRVCRAIDQGVPQTEALRGLARRMDDADIFEIVFAINTAEERGTRLKETLSGLAEQMRHRRIQWLERAAEEAKVHITWPGLLVMVACLLIVAAPLLLPGLGSVGR
ncbi:MAG TPA: type II secretion system F family protein [Gemmataceae bacterium]|nr:type II secretion system F family protein [Gemmataceae bacterium]